MNEDFNINISEEEIEKEEKEVEFEEKTSSNPPEFSSFFGMTSYKEYLEQEKFKRNNKAVGFCFLASYLIILVINVLLSFVFFLLSGNSFLNYMQDPAVNQVLNIFFSLFVYLIPFVLVAKLFKFKISDVALFKKPEKGNRLTLFLLGISFCSFANIAVNYASALFEGMGMEYNVDFGDNPQGIFGFLITMIATMAVPALIEEFAVRGVALGILRKFGDSFAIITSSILFALMHRNFQQLPFAFLVGLILGFITVKSDSVWIAVGVHAFNNGTAVLLDYLTENLSVQVSSLIFTLFFMVTLIAGIVALFFSGSKKELFKLKKSDTIMTEGTKLKKFLLSLPVLLFTIMCIIESLGYFFV